MSCGSLDHWAWHFGTEPSQARRNQANANSLEGPECIRAGFYSAVCNLKAPTGARDPPRGKAWQRHLFAIIFIASRAFI